MRTITLELLRHGPPHNQLLSPLTPYLALCENHQAVTLHVPFEHNQFLYRLQALIYEQSADVRAFQIKDTGRVLGDMLGGVPGLIAELSRNHPPSDAAITNAALSDQAFDPASDRHTKHARERQGLTHLRLILSASELALLPFELALASDGFPGAGQHLLLQSYEPICITREVRRVAEHPVRWPDRPRILFVAAAPPGTPSIPAEAHLLALRRLVDPWVARHSDGDISTHLSDHLVFLPNATAEALEAETARGHFTHVHILAHGIEYRQGYDVRFGLAFHNTRTSDGQPDIVDGERLSTILRAQENDGNGLAQPAVVTLASCNSGNVGTVAGVAASIAHSLHESGIPIVVASQFPLSFSASVLMVEVLYRSLLWGEDPRIALDDLRRRLHSELRYTHDWASITAYAALPPNFERILTATQIAQVRRNINVSLNQADRATIHFQKRTVSPLSEDQKAELLKDAYARIDAAKGRLKRLIDRTTSERARIYGLLASTEKRQAEIDFSFSHSSVAPPGRDYLQNSIIALSQARAYYWQAFLLDRSNSWGVVQYLSLDLILDHTLAAPSSVRQNGPKPEHKQLEALWTLAHVLSLYDVSTREPTRMLWGYANLIELYLLGILMPHVTNQIGGVNQLTARAIQRAKDLVDHAGQDTFEIYSTRRQMLRYTDWYAELAAGGIGPLSVVAEQVVNVLPEPERTSWQ